MGLPSGTYSTHYAQDMAIVRTKTQWALLIGFLVFLFCLPLFAGPRVLNFLIIGGITLIAVHGLNILTGYCGS